MNYTNIDFLRDKIKNCNYELIDYFEQTSLDDDELEILEKIFSNYALNSEIEYDQLKNIYENESSLDDKIILVIFQFFFKVKEVESLTLIGNFKEEHDYLNNKLINFSLLTFGTMNKINFKVNEIFDFCDRLYAINGGERILYKELSNLIRKKNNLSEEIIEEYKIIPRNSINYLVVYLVVDEQKHQSFISNLNLEDEIVLVMLVQLCLTIVNNDRDFVVKIVKEKITSRINEDNDDYILISNYVLLLFNILKSRAEDFIVEEIKRVTSLFDYWNKDNIINFSYQEMDHLNSEYFESLFWVIEMAPVETIEKSSYLIDKLFAKLDDKEFRKYYLKILFNIGIKGNRSGGSILERILNNPELFIDELVETILNVDSQWEISLKIIKSIDMNRLLDNNLINEKHYLYLLRFFHCFEIDADFICHLGINFLLNTSSKEHKTELINYMKTSVCDNYFYTLKVMINQFDGSNIDELKQYLKAKDEFMERSYKIIDFKPSSKNMEKFYEKEFEQRRKLQEEGEKLSVFYKVIKQSTVLYGNKTKYVHQDINGELHFQESKMSEMKYSIAIPVRFINDPNFFRMEREVVLRGYEND